MKILSFVILSMVFILAGCKTVGEYAGTGPLALHPKTKVFLDQVTDRDGIVAVSYQGNYAYAYSCRTKQGCEVGGYDPAAVIANCEQKASRCAIYSDRGFVLWKGSVTVRN